MDPRPPENVALDETQRADDLVQALQSSRTIGKAIGLVMERFDLDDHEAFEHLTGLSQKSDVGLGELAAHLIEQSNELRHAARAREPSHQRPSPGLTLVPRLEASGKAHEE